MPCLLFWPLFFHRVLLLSFLCFLAAFLFLLCFHWQIRCLWTLGFLVSPFSLQGISRFSCRSFCQVFEALSCISQALMLHKGCQMLLHLLLPCAQDEFLGFLRFFIL